MQIQPVVVAYGMGVDSTAMLIGLNQRGIRPDLILFADTGGEKPDTYLYAPIIRQWLRDVDFPQLEVVRYQPPIAPYDSLYGECHQNRTLPSLAFRMKSCSIKWKLVPQDRRVQKWEPAHECWDAGKRVKKLIGFDATETRRRYGDRGNDPLYQHWYPLMDWRMDREACKRLIAAAGLPVPVKSACFFCPASKRHEVVQLSCRTPSLHRAALVLEDRYRDGKHYRREDAKAVQGLGIRRTWSELVNRQSNQKGNAFHMHDLRHKAIAHRQAQEDYSTAFRDYFANQVAELPEDRFWELQTVLRTEVIEFRFGYGRTNGVEQAASELFRKPLANDFGKYDNYSLDDAISFAKSWEGWSGRLYQSLFNVVEDRGNDAYCDLLDALPLAGRDLVRKALAREFGNQRQFEAVVLEGCGGNEQLAKLILHGENYIAMALAKAAQEYFAAQRDGETPG